MCVKLRGNQITPGDILAFFTKLGKASGTWGFKNGSQYNVRLDSVPTIWKKISSNRGIIKADCFWEKNQKFTHIDGSMMNIGIIYDGLEFAVITTEASSIVKPYHHRMPLIISDKGLEKFLDNHEILELPFGQVKLVA